MAKKPKSDDAETSDTGAEAPKSKKKLMIIVLAVVLLAGGGGGGYFFFMKKGPEAAKVEVKKPSVFLDVPDMIVNLAAEPNQERQKLFKFRVALEVVDQPTVLAIKPLMPRIEDAFQVFVRELRASDLEGSAGVYRLREELLRRVNAAVYPSKVDAILFKEIVVQ